MQIRPATPADCLHIAELAQIAGDRIPGHFWADTQQPGQSLIEAGAEQLRSESSNFSYRNATLACDGDRVAAMVLAYRLPAAADNDEDPADFPELVRPMVELEQCVPESYYVNMLATYPEYRGQGLGGALMQSVEEQAHTAACSLISIEVFANNHGALRLYQRLGFNIVDRRPIIASEYHPADDVLLLTRPTPG